MLLCYEILDMLTYKNKRLFKYRLVSKGKNKGKKIKCYFYINICKYCGNEMLSYHKNGCFCNSSCHWKFIHDNMTDDDKIKFKQKISNTKMLNPKPVWNKRNFDYAIYDTYEKKIGWIDKVRRNKNQDDVLETLCLYCGKWFIPTLGAVKSRVNTLLYNEIDRSKFYCSQGCKDACPIFNKHSNIIDKKQATSREVQPQLRQLVLKRDNYTCQECGAIDTELHCHHIWPLNESPITSADVDECITYCKDCHKLKHEIPGCGYDELKC